MTLDRPGFADPATDAQSCFRAVLHAMSRPGTITSAGAGLLPPAPLDPATAAVLLTLSDADTPLWLDPAAASAADWAAFHCGAPRARRIGAAAFACTLTMPALSSLHPGTDLAPENSATLILQVPAVGQGTPLRLDGLPDDFAAQWAANHALYPCGVDLVLCAGERLCALPRSVRIEEG